MRITSTEDPLKVLLVEDNKGDAVLVERALRQAMMGALTLRVCGSLESALLALSEDNFDIVLLDRSLPDVVGFSGLQSIQNHSPKMPVVFLTAYQDEETALEAIQQGAQDYLFKDKIDAHVIKRAIQYASLRKQFEGVLIMRANFDSLTGLANRILFESRLEMALAKLKRQGGNCAVLFIDLNKFKSVNDELGHAAGDQVLREIGKRLRSVLRTYDTVARFGGDEFAVLLEGLPELHHSEVVANKIIACVEKPLLIDEQPVQVGASIGIAGVSAHMQEDSATLMQQADEAMYQAKTQGMGNSCFCQYYPSCSLSKQQN